MQNINLRPRGIQTIFERLTQLSALLIFDALMHGAFGDVSNRACIVRTTPQARQDSAEIIKLFADHARGITLELNHDVRREAWDHFPRTSERGQASLPSRESLP